MNTLVYAACLCVAGPSSRPRAAWSLPDVSPSSWRTRDWARPSGRCAVATASAVLRQQDAAHDCRQTSAAFVMETTAFVCGRWKKRAPHFPYSIILYQVDAFHNLFYYLLLFHLNLSPLDELVHKIISNIQAFDTARAEGWFIGEMIWNFAGNRLEHRVV